MSNGFRCPECGSTNHVFGLLNRSLLAISSDLDTEVVLERILDTARELIHASYAAVGVGDGRGGFSHFITSGGGHGTRVPAQAEVILAAVLRGPEPYVTNDIQKEPHFEGWPEGYPDLKSLLGLPIKSGGEIVGAFYLANENTWGFRPEDKDLVELLAPHAGLAIRNVRLYEQTRELSVAQERNRLARDLHDSVTQTLFSMKLAAESANVLVDTDPAQARLQLERVQELARHATKEMRALVFELRPPEFEVEGLIPTLRSHIDVLRRLHPIEIDFEHRGGRVLEPDHEKEIFRIVQEALNNVIRHAGASQIAVELVIEENKLQLTVTDDGVGFDPSLPRPSRRLGLVSMNERAQAIGAELSISSAPGAGTTVSLETSP